MKSFLFTISYRYILYPFLFIIFKFLSLSQEKIRRGLEMRKKKNGFYPWLNLPKKTNPIWVHCSSGEFEYAKPVLRELKKSFPDKKILVTYFSPSAEKSISSATEVDMSSPLPWDTVNSWQEFLNHHQPQVLLIARTDLWPEMLVQTKKHKIPSLLFSATLTKNSIRMHSLGRIYYSHIMSLISEVYCVTKEDYENFKYINHKTKTTIAGDTRYDQVIHRLQHPKKIDIKTHSEFFLRPEKTFLLGSTWEEDENILVSTLGLLKKNSISCKTIIAPHEPSKAHLKKLQEKLKKENLTYKLYSDPSSTKDFDVLIIDKIGILADLYAYASCAFVGGSFKKTVHSVMEPLTAGCLTFVGPKHINNREALLFQKYSLEPLKSLTAVTPFLTSNDLYQHLTTWFNSTKDHSLLKSKIQNKLQQQTGKSSLVVEFVKNSIDSI